MKRVWRVLMLIGVILANHQIGGVVSAEEEVLVPRPHRCAGTIALTFDDGPDPDLTNAVLDTLLERRIRVTFFVTGNRISGNEDIIQRMVNEGHSVQNHTWDHPYLTTLTDEELARQLNDTSAAIVAAGAPAPVYVRPPFGDYDARVAAGIEATGMTSVTWTNALDTRDWEGITADELIARIIGNLESGGVVLLHDIQPNTVATLPTLIDEVHGRGYCINPYQGEEFWKLDA